MRFDFRSMAAYWAVTVLLAAAGCGGQADGTAAIGDLRGGKPASASDQPDQDPLHPVVTIETSLGKIAVRLDAEKAPLTVENFLAYVDRRHYDQTIFHQVIQDDPKVILGGAFTTEGVEKNASTAIRNEAHNGLKNRRGTIAMARQADAIDSATCHFFLNLSDNEVLDHNNRTLDGYGYCVFGEVIDGIDVADKIGTTEVHDVEQFERIPVETVMIRSIRRRR